VQAGNAVELGQTSRRRKASALGLVLLLSLMWAWLGFCHGVGEETLCFLFNNEISSLYSSLIYEPYLPLCKNWVAEAEI
jgi:hypothetical protein